MSIIGKKCKIEKHWLNSEAEANIEYRIISEPNVNDFVSIEPIEWASGIKPIENVPIESIEIL